MLAIRWGVLRQPTKLVLGYNCRKHPRPSLSGWMEASRLYVSKWYSEADAGRPAPARKPGPASVITKHRFV